MTCCAEHQVVMTSWNYIFGMFSSSPFLSTIFFGPILLILISMYPLLILLTPKEKKLQGQAFNFITEKNQKEIKKLPKLLKINSQDDLIQLSIIIPAFNEEERIIGMLNEVIDYLNYLKSENLNIQGEKGVDISDNFSTASHRALENPLNSIEILIVDDGSIDKTVELILDFSLKNNLQSIIKIIKLGKNFGKGKAIRHGILHARGSLILFCDADGATKFKDLRNLSKEMKRIITLKGFAIVCGSRAHLIGSEAVIKRSFLRNFLMHSFHLILSILMRPKNPFSFIKIQKMFSNNNNKQEKRQFLPIQPIIRDTQCGFKLFTRQTCQLIFPFCHIDRWIFDVEFLLIAEMISKKTLEEEILKNQNFKFTNQDPLLQLPLPISEISVDWKEITGSKINILKDSLKMALDLLIIRLNFAFGRWKIPNKIPNNDDVLNNSIEKHINGDVKDSTLLS